MRPISLVLLACALTTSAQTLPRLPDGKPNLTGLWQSITTANWNIEDHSADYGPQFNQLGALSAVPPGMGIVEGGVIPYRMDAMLKRDQNRAAAPKEDPEAKCYMPGVPRATYMPYPFQIIQSTDKILIAYQFATANRTIAMKDHTPSLTDSWMGWSNGSWDGDTLVVDVTGLNGKSWFDRSGNYASNKVHIVERYTLLDKDHIQYEATIEDPAVFTRPWKISLPLYRLIDKNAKLLEFKCVEFSEELLYGDLTKK